MNCGPGTINAKFLKEHQMAKLKKIFDVFSNPLIRSMELGVDPQSTRAMDVMDWMYEKTGVHPYYDPEKFFADDNRLVRSLTQALQFESQYKKGIKNFTGFLAKMQKNFYLPERVAEKYLVGVGIRDESDIFHAMNIVGMRAHGMRSRMAETIGKIAMRLEEMTGVANKIAMRRITDIEKQISETKEEDYQKRAMLRQKREKMLAGESEEFTKGENLAMKANRDIVLALHGLILKDGKLKKVPVRQTKVEGEETDHPAFYQTIDVLDLDGLRAHFSKSWGRDRDAKILVDITDRIREVLDGTTTLIKDAVGYQQENYRLALVRQLNMDPAEAEEWIQRNVKLNEVEHYFPRVAIRRLRLFDDVLQTIQRSTRDPRDVRKIVEEKLTEGKKLVEAGDAKDREAFMLDRADESFMLRRQSDQIVVDNYSMELLGTLAGHIEDAVTYWEVNNRSLRANKYLAKLYAARKLVPEQDRLAYAKYVNGVAKYLIDLADAGRNVPQSGVMNDIARSTVALAATAAMGLPNIATPLRNFIEGSAMTMMAAGKLFPGGANVDPLIKKVYEKEYTAFKAEQLLMEPDANRRRDAISRRWGSQPEGRRYMEVERFGMATTRMVADVLGNVASKALIAQTTAENVLRRTAWLSGASMEYDLIYNQFHDSFRVSSRRQDIPESVLNRVGLTREDVKRNWKSAWEQFAKTRITNAGYDMVFRTQWNYNAMNRARWERGGARVFTMFQHFPASWLVTFGRSAQMLGLMAKAGATGEGMTGLLKAINPMRGMKTEGRRPEDMTMTSTHMLAWAAAHGASFALTHLAGLHFGLFNNPLAELLIAMFQDVKDGDLEMSRTKNETWNRGIVNNFTGPVFGSLIDAINVSMFHAGVRDGSLPEILNLTLGLSTDPDVINQDGRRMLVSANGFDEPEDPGFGGFMRDLGRVANDGFFLGGWNGARKLLDVSAAVSPHYYDVLSEAPVVGQALALTDPTGKTKRKVETGKTDFNKSAMQMLGLYHMPWNTLFSEAPEKNRYR